MPTYDLHHKTVSAEMMGRLYDEDDQMETIYRQCPIAELGNCVELQRFKTTGHFHPDNWVQYKSEYFMTCGGGPESGYVITTKDTDYGASITNISMISRIWLQPWVVTDVYADEEGVASVVATIYGTEGGEQKAIRIRTYCS
jgi:hypothetical protein